MMSAAAILFVVLLGAQQPEVPADAVIRLQRTSCFGPCPVYTVTVGAQGIVTYDGERHVRVVGQRMARISPSAVATLLARAGQIGFFEMRDAYLEKVTDLPTTFVTVTVNGRTKRIEDYLGAPEALKEFEREIDAAAGTVRWVSVDELELEELVRSGWSASSEESVRLLQQAIERDDITVAIRLIELGVVLKDALPFHSARSSAMVDALVIAGADPNERPRGRTSGRTPLMSTAYKDAAVAAALLKAGARLEDMDGGRTALFLAACSGNWRVVTVLLEAGANPRGSTIKTSALECARTARGSVGSFPRAFGGPTVDDFDQVIALLENAERRWKP